jgi:hypothetical protein
MNEDAELERLQDEASKARKVAADAQAIADQKTDEAQRYAAFVLAKYGVCLHFPKDTVDVNLDARSPRSRPNRRRGSR